jgi:hypothetical protein
VPYPQNLSSKNCQSRSDSLYCQYRSSWQLGRWCDN